MKSIRKRRPAIRYGLPVVVVLVLFGVALRWFIQAAVPTAFEAESGTVASGAAKVTDATASASAALRFGAGSVTAANGYCGATAAPPAQYRHVIWIWEENHDATAVNGGPNAPYINSVTAKCAQATNVLDNSVTVALVSEPNYAAGTSGSNCNVGITTATGNGTGCITGDGDHSSYSLNTQSIFGLAKASGKTWKSYMESMPGTCALASSGRYAYKHNPAAFYNPILADCQTSDVTMPVMSCSTTAGAGCSTVPTGAFVDDINAGTLPAFSFISPNLDNDMHDGTVAQGDNWLNAYVSKIVAGPNYKSGDTAIFIMWDEGSANTGASQPLPNVVISPYINPGTVVTTATNNIGLLRTTQDLLGLSPYLGCASGTPSGGGTNCSPGSTTSIRTELGM